MAYKVQAGDTLGKIAQNQGATLEQILALNPEITNPNMIRAGQDILLPDTPEDEVVSLESEFDAPAPVEPRNLAEVVPPVEEESSMVDSMFGAIGDIGAGLVNMLIPSARADVSEVPEENVIKVGEPPPVEAVADIAASKNPASVAMKYLGMSEDNKEGAEAIRGFFDNAVGNWRADMTPEQFAKETPWCAAFVTQVLRDSGVNPQEELGQDNFNQIRAASYAKAGVGVSPELAKPGDVMVKFHDEATRKKYNTGPAHTGIVVKVEGDTVWYVGGNTGDKVEVSSYSLKDNDIRLRRVRGASDIPPESLPSITELRIGKAGRKIADELSSFFSASVASPQDPNVNINGA